MCHWFILAWRRLGLAFAVVFLLVAVCTFVTGAPAPLPRARTTSQLERLLLADESLPFSSNGQMVAAFTTRSADWKVELRSRLRETGEPTKKVEAALRKERMKERDIVVGWIRAGASRKDYEEDRFKVRTILQERCAICHTEGGSGDLPLKTYDDLKKYLVVEHVK